MARAPLPTRFVAARTSAITETAKRTQITAWPLNSFGGLSLENFSASV